MTGTGATARARVSAIGIAGEILVTLGVIVGLFVVWEIWINDWVSDTGQAATAHAYSQQWADAPVVPTPAAADVATDPPVTAQPKAGTIFANLIVPRFGSDYTRPIAEGVGLDVLNDVSRGMGHYEQTALPGAIGNVAIASHRTAYGGALHLLPDLRIGDHVYIETVDGWYQYSYRNTEYVLVSGVGVLDPVPQVDGASPGDRLLTMTTCNPIYSSAERIIAYAVFDRFYPRAEGAPSEIASLAGTPKGT